MKFVESRRRARRTKRWLFIGLALAFIGSGITWWCISMQPKVKTVSFSASSLQLHVAYPETVSRQPLSKKDAADKILLRLARGSTNDPPLQISLRYETGLKPLSELTKQKLRDALLANLAKTYPTRFPGYKQLERHDYSLDSHDATDLLFSYKNQAGETIKQRFLLVIRDDDTAVYLSAQAKATDFDALNARYFGIVFSSLRL
jgi:hypothetical protein